MSVHLRLVTPTTDNRTVTPERRPNAELRTREYLTDREIEQLTEAARANRNGHRDATMLLVAYRHGLRASELVDLRWDQIDFETASLAVRRAQERLTGDASNPRRRAAGAAPAAARAGTEVAVRVHI
jgi:type 1 fimbriae regulatory protein FimB/type 1 fimbriae regulatory protein FimE